MTDDLTPDAQDPVESSVAHPSGNSSEEQPSLSVGDRVRVIELPPYVKTADPMPMLRPPDVIQVGEEGTILERRSGNYWSVRFSRGVFLMENRYIERL